MSATPPSAVTDPGSSRRSGATDPRTGELIFALGVVSAGIYAAVASRSIPEPVSAGSVGPRAVPLLVGIFMIVAGAAVAVEVLRGHAGRAEEGEDVDAAAGTDWRTVGLLLLAFVVHIALIRPVGWPVAAALLFTASAWILGSRPLWRVAVIGVVLALLLQLVFAGALGVSLPPGPLFAGVPFLHG